MELRRLRGAAVFEMEGGEGLSYTQAAMGKAAAGKQASKQEEMQS